MKDFLLIIFTIGVVLIYNGCMHDSLISFDMDIDPLDTTMTPGDTMNTDTMDMDTIGMDTTGNNMICDTNKVYFNTTILPILKSNCAYSGCHDAETAQNGVVLDSYENVISTAEIVPYDLEESELFEVLVTNDLDKRMPLSSELDNDLILLIAEWILQGADNEVCDSEDNSCGNELVTYDGIISNLMKTHCNGCHGAGVASGGIITDNYNGLKKAVDDGRLYGALAWQEGFQMMPRDQDQLDSCDLVNVKKWIDEGAQNN